MQDTEEWIETTDPAVWRVLCRHVTRLYIPAYLTSDWDGSFPHFWKLIVSFQKRQRKKEKLQEDEANLPVPLDDMLLQMLEKGSSNRMDHTFRSSFKII